MLLIFTLIILNSILLYLINLEWYFSIGVMLFLMAQIMSLNYDVKIIIDKGLLEHDPNQLGRLLPRTLSNSDQASPSKSTST